jgi:hypothetical protein
VGVTLDFFRPGDLVDTTALFARLEMVIPLFPALAFDRQPQTRDADAEALGKMEDTLFVGDVPRAEATSAKELTAYSGFGRYLAWLWSAGSRPPFPVALFVVRYAFGGRLRPIDFEGEALSEEDIPGRIRPIELQLNAIRSGVAGMGGCDLADPPGFPAAVVCQL